MIDRAGWHPRCWHRQDAVGVGFVGRRAHPRRAGMAEPHQQVVVEDGITKASVQTADGRVTLVSVQPDGTITRGQEFTDDQGRKVNVHDDGREHEEVTTDLKNGVVFTDKTDADGNFTHTETYAREDGSLDIDVTDANGGPVR